MLHTRSAIEHDDGAPAVVPAIVGADRIGPGATGWLATCSLKLPASVATPRSRSNLRPRQLRDGASRGAWVTLSLAVTPVAIKATATSR